MKKRQITQKFTKDLGEQIDFMRTRGVSIERIVAATGLNRSCVVGYIKDKKLDRRFKRLSHLMKFDIVVGAEAGESVESLAQRFGISIEHCSDIVTYPKRHDVRLPISAKDTLRDPINQFLASAWGMSLKGVCA